MDEKMKELYELCETVSEAIREANEKIRAAGGKLSGSDVDYVDKLTHALKSIKATMSMMEEEGEYSGNSFNMAYGSYAGGRGGNQGGQGGGQSNRGGSYRGGSSRGNGSYEGGSYARGRGRNARRDSMGRYSSEGGYSSADGLADELRELAEEAPNEQIKREMERLVEKIEMMM